MPVSIIIFEHKSTPEKDVLVQILNYMVLEWQKDIEAKQRLKVIIPFIFYHGEKKWNIPRSFADQFDVSNDLKAFMVDYKYMFFNTGDHDFFAEENRGLKKNVFLFTTMVLLQNAYNENMKVVEEIMRFWREKGLIHNNDIIMVYLMYICETRDVPLKKLTKILEESKLEGGDFMPSLAQRLRDEGREIGVKEGEKIGEKRGEMRRAKTNAIQMLNDGVPVRKVCRYTGLTEKEVKELMS
ncbi:MAG: hypothetical protein GY940_35455 [bacterium]|nr:hypothetical protein [bacterium]